MIILICSCTELFLHWLVCAYILYYPLLCCMCITVFNLNNYLYKYVYVLLLGTLGINYKIFQGLIDDKNIGTHFLGIN